MHYRSIEDLNRLVVENCYRIPRDVDLIVGVPRSGMLVANLFALHLNLPFTDLDGMLSDKIMSSGIARAEFVPSIKSIGESRKTMIVDDSLLSGTEMKRVRAMVSEHFPGRNFLYCVALCVPGSVSEVDLALELCPTPRVFEWNLLHGHMLRKCCVDIDGVLCQDPTAEENDDGPKYGEFLANARPLWRPTVTIGRLVTSRLEKYRELTEQWLKECGIEFDELVMMQYKTQAERQRAQKYAEFKAEAYVDSGAALFIESSDLLSAEIARLSGKPALCIETQQMYQPSGLPYAKRRIVNAVSEAESLAVRAVRKLRRMSPVHSRAP